jgi:hypothetical protein
MRRALVVTLIVLAVPFAVVTHLCRDFVHRSVSDPAFYPPLLAVEGEPPARTTPRLPPSRRSTKRRLGFGYRRKTRRRRL